MDNHSAAVSRMRPQLWSQWLDRWLRRRTRTQPPLRLVYRQIFILPTGFGWMLGLLMFGMLMGSLNFNNNLGLLTTFIVAGLGLNSMLLAYYNLNDLDIRATIGSSVFAGQDAVLRITLINHRQRPRPSLRIESKSGADQLSIAGLASAEAELSVPTAARGWLDVGRLRLQTSHPTGLFRAWTWFWPQHLILVWPCPASNPPPLPQGDGQRFGSRFQREPEGEEFHSLRPWRSGDPLHRIAWKASERHQILLSRELRTQRSDRLLFDLCAAPGHDLEQRIAILAAWLLQAHRENRQWVLRSDGAELGPGGDEAFLIECLNELACL